jgi:hypothetical protein
MNLKVSCIYRIRMLVIGINAENIKNHTNKSLEMINDAIKSTECKIAITTFNLLKKLALNINILAKILLESSPNENQVKIRA